MQLFIVSGLIGSGKSTVSKLLKKKGFHYFDSDNIAKKLLRTNNTIKAKLVKFFDKDILSKNKISIKKVKEKFLTSNKNREYINKTIHPIFFLYINSKLNKLKNLKAVLELPLIETAKNITAPFKIITIDSTYHKRMNRSVKSKKISKKDFTKLNKIQKNRSFYINKSNYILVNNDTMSSLKNKFEKLYLTKILKK